jgi:hypothetical protein
MPPPAPSVQQLIESVVGDEPLKRLENAATMAQELQTAGDALLDHFVGACRAAGHSWAEISTALGVTKQAVHKRFSTPNYTLERFTARARRALDESKAAAVALGQQYVGTEHMLLGLFPPGGVAADVLKDFGVTRAKVEKRLNRGDATLTADDPVPFTPHAKTALEGALREALGLGHNYIGTEHLLLSLVHTPEGLAAKLLDELGVEQTKLGKAVLDKLRDYIKKPQ